MNMTKDKNGTIIIIMVITNKHSISMAKIVTVTANSFTRKEISITMIEKILLKQFHKSHQKPKRTIKSENTEINVVNESN